MLYCAQLDGALSTDRCEPLLLLRKISEGPVGAVDDIKLIFASESAFRVKKLYHDQNFNATNGY